MQKIFCRNDKQAIQVARLKENIMRKEAAADSFSPTDKWHVLGINYE